jgi:hypothetical protein
MRIEVEAATSGNNDHLGRLRWPRHLLCLADVGRFQRGGRRALSSCRAQLAKRKARDFRCGHHDFDGDGSNSWDRELSERYSSWMSSSHWPSMPWCSSYGWGAIDMRVTATYRQGCEALLSIRNLWRPENYLMELRMLQTGVFQARTPCSSTRCRWNGTYCDGTQGLASRLRP